MLRNKKRIEALEKEVFSLKCQIEEIKSEVSGIRGTIEALVDEMAVVHLDGEEYIKVLNETAGRAYKAEDVALMRDIYEKKLRRFIRSTTSRRKPKTTTDGKENTKATE